MRWATTCLSAASLLVLAAGLAASPLKRPASIVNWSKPGRDGRACVSCHSVPGREVWGLPAADVRRRGALHLSTEDAEAVAISLGEIGGPERLGTVRPFEPAGGSFAGDVASRDEQFGRSLERLVPKLTSSEIWSLSEAEAAAEELCRTPLSEVKTGLIFDPISRDPVRRCDGPMLGDWVPDVALSPSGTEAFEAACEGPLDILRIDGAIRAAEGKPKSAIAELSRLKRLALLKYVDNPEGRPQPTVVPRDMPEDPIWGVGNFARLYHGMTPEQIGMTEATAETAGVEMGQPLDLNQMALSWFWVGWTLDPTLQHSSLELRAKIGQYMAQALWDAGPYPWHAAYFAARRPVEERAESKEGFQPEVNAFVNEDVLLRLAPTDKEERRNYARFCANVLRMHCLLMERDAKAGRVLANAFSARQQMNALLVFVEKNLESGEARRTRALVVRTLSAIK